MLRYKTSRVDKWQNKYSSCSFSLFVSSVNLVAVVGLNLGVKCVWLLCQVLRDNACRSAKRTDETQLDSQSQCFC